LFLKEIAAVRHLRRVFRERLTGRLLRPELAHLRPCLVNQAKVGAVVEEQALAAVE
jgi:hypothetical protein